MALYSGVTGYIKKGVSSADDVIAHMSSWEVQLTREMIERISYSSFKDWNKCP